MAIVNCPEFLHVNVPTLIHPTFVHAQVRVMLSADRYLEHIDIQGFKALAATLLHHLV
jgi:hypothetical protein